jgi:hypothetical protein
MSERHVDRLDWSQEEVEATVADYFEMLLMERRNEPFNKAERNRNLQQLLNQRSHGAVERKHQNISAILIDLGLPYVEGYKPLINYQQLLREVVQDRVARTPELLSLVMAEINQPATVPLVEDILNVLKDAPPRRERAARDRVRERRRVYERHVNYLLLEARNSALGRAGEEFVVNFERARLISEGHARLADRIEHVSNTRGDQAGYDILSFEQTGRERLIEVKTTVFGMYTPFYVTPNELETSKEVPDRYHVYRLYTFRRNPQMFALQGAVDSTCDLEPSEFLARL